MSSGRTPPPRELYTERAPRVPRGARSICVCGVAYCLCWCRARRRRALWMISARVSICASVSGGMACTVARIAASCCSVSVPSAGRSRTRVFFVAVFSPSFVSGVGSGWRIVASPPFAPGWGKVVCPCVPGAHTGVLVTVGEVCVVSSGRCVSPYSGCRRAESGAQCTVGTVTLRAVVGVGGVGGAPVPPGHLVGVFGVGEVLQPVVNPAPRFPGDRGEFGDGNSFVGCAAERVQ